MKAAALRAARRIVALLCLLPVAAPAQPGTERPDGLRDPDPRWHAITGARLVVAPGRVVERGTLVMKDGLIVAAGADVPVPAGAREWKLEGRTVYAGFIDLASPVGVPPVLRALPAAPMPGRAEAPASAPRPAELRPGQRALASRNRWLRAEQDVAAQLQPVADELRAARAIGFTAVLATPAAGLFRGQGALISLADGRDAKALVIAPRVTQHLSHEPHRQRDGSYPSSTMGSIALARQALYDARWYRAATAQPRADGERVEPDATLEALAAVLGGGQPLVHVAADEQDYARIARLRDEFGLRSIALGNGHEYRRAAVIAKAALPVIVPLAFPSPPAVDDPDAALDIGLDRLQHWEQAPSNPALLERAGVRFALSAHGLKNPRREFWPRLHEALRRGLAPQRALAALTTEPAALIGQQARLGTLEPGRVANLVVAGGDLFVPGDAAIELSFVDGRPYPAEHAERGDPRGTWQVDGSDERFEITGPRDAPRLAGDGRGCTLAGRGRTWTWQPPCTKQRDAASAAQVVAERIGDRLEGTRQAADGSIAAWQARRVAAAAATPASAPELPPAPPATYPAGAYGIGTPPQPGALLVRHATIWTQGPAGTLSDADLLVRAGRIAAVGRGLAAPEGATVIDASGLHLTPGLIDAHSHIAIAGSVNEGTHGVTAEVRIADVLDATDISIYRQLAGGLTAANVLHGSANSIGGQNAVIKLRWGQDADGLLFAGAEPGIKFALGENPKRSNWGGPRYPATRMGVEQVLRDSFAAAAEYAAARERWRRSPGGRPEPRRDLQLEALAEVLAGTRAVHVHSYRADEILMFARLARELGFRVAAFQHVLEGYKVADAIASIGAGASTFSDWWAYKMEVWDAVPHNGALLQRAGVLTSFNSDNAELARRLNTEAAKAIKYGSLAEAEALALVTINAARQLGVGTRTGSIEVGKDADFVLWDAPPLSTAARAQQTWIDGRRWWDREADRALREAAAAERTRLTAKALAARAEAAADRRPGDSGARAGPRIAEADLGTLRWRAALDRSLDTLHAERRSYADGAGEVCTAESP